MNDVVNLAEKFASLEGHWNPGIVASLNNYHVKIVKVLGEFTWHSHADTDELFLVLKGDLTIELRDQVLSLAPGDLYVVPRGVEHKPVADQECEILLIEPAGTVNTGNNPGVLTVDKPREL